MPRPLDFRPLMGDGFFSTFDGWPAWLRDLRRRCGVYVIRRRNDKQVLYVGESHTGRLYKTITRHFQAWSGKTAGPLYDRQAVEVAVRVTPPPAAVGAQNNLIDRLAPRDNTNGGNENPF